MVGDVGLVGDGLCAAFLGALGGRRRGGVYAAAGDAAWDDLADHVVGHVDVNGLLAAATPLNRKKSLARPETL